MVGTNHEHKVLSPILVRSADFRFLNGDDDKQFQGLFAKMSAQQRSFP